MKRALIIGSEGQDGRLLSDLLADRGYSLLGIDLGTIKARGISWNSAVDITDRQDVFSVVKNIKPGEIYFLAAFQQSSEGKQIESYELLTESYRVNVFALINALEAIRLYSPKSRLFYAASSHVFGRPDRKIQDESTPFRPVTVYGITKADGVMACRYYRETCGIFACAGILYNHESRYRDRSFISKKIIRGAIEIKNNLRNKLKIGDLKAQVDWGYAPDYVDAIHRMVLLDKPDDFIIATGEKHSVREFAETTFSLLGLDWKKYVEEDRTIITHKSLPLVGNPGKIMKKTGWKPTVDFKSMVKLLLIAEGADIK